MICHVGGELKSFGEIKFTECGKQCGTDVISLHLIITKIHLFIMILKYFSNYLKFIIEQPRFEEFCSTCHEVTWCIDKDIKHPGNRNYYPEYMSLITQSENSKARIKDKGKPISRRPIIGINKDTGKVLLFKSKSEAGGTFDSRTLHRCLTKKPKYKSHRGYKWYYINYKHNKIYRRL